MNVDATVTLGDGFATIRRAGTSRVTVARVLGLDRDAHGEPCRLWLDRLVHSPRESSLGAWSVSGAVSSVLSR